MASIFLGLKLTFEQIQMLQNPVGTENRKPKTENTWDSQRVNLFRFALGLRYHRISFTFSPGGAIAAVKILERFHPGNCIPFTIRFNGKEASDICALISYH